MTRDFPTIGEVLDIPTTRSVNLAANPASLMAAR